jgi:RNA polymerase sigma factor (sigma-70 family)
MMSDQVATVSPADELDEGPVRDQELVAAYRGGEADALGRLPGPVGKDQELVAAYRGGDADALGEIYRAHYPGLWRAARRYTNDPHEADDLAQEAFLRVALALRRGSGGVAHLGGYLNTTVRHLAGWRARKGACVHLVDDVGRYERPVIEHLPEDAYLEMAFQALPERWRLALWLRLVERRSRADVGIELGVSPEAAGMLVRRALQGLRQAYFAQVGWCGSDDPADSAGPTGSAESAEGARGARGAGPTGSAGGAGRAGGGRDRGTDPSADSRSPQRPAARCPSGQQRVPSAGTAPSIKKALTASSTHWLPARP